MSSTALFWILTTVFLITAAIARAQQPAKVPRIGYLSANSSSVAASRTAVFRQGLLELGYVDGKNILLEFRYADQIGERLPALASELARLKVDVIVTGGPSATRAAKDATHTIPIVMTQDSDPVANRFIASLARPGGNITGLSTLAPEITGKQLELLEETLPRLANAALLGTSSQPGNALVLKETELAAAALKVQLLFLDASSPKDFDGAFRAAVKSRTEAVLVLQSPIILSYRKEIVALAAMNRLAAMYPQTDYTEAGGLMVYGPQINDLYRRAATYVDKILKGRTPADLPVEQPKQFEFIVNLKAAKQIGLTIPPTVLARADRVIR